MLLWLKHHFKEAYKVSEGKAPHILNFGIIGSSFSFRLLYPRHPLNTKLNGFLPQLVPTVS